MAIAIFGEVCLWFRSKGGWGDQLVHSPHRISAVQGSTTLMVGSTQILADGVERIRPDCEHSMELIINLNLDFERENVNVFTSADLESSESKCLLQIHLTFP